MEGHLIRKQLIVKITQLFDRTVTHSATANSVILAAIIPSTQRPTSHHVYCSCHCKVNKQELILPSAVSGRLCCDVCRDARCESLTGLVSVSVLLRLRTLSMMANHLLFCFSGSSCALILLYFCVRSAIFDLH